MGYLNLEEEWKLLTEELKTANFKLGEESAYKFYKGNGEYYIGTRTDTRYYHRIMYYRTGEVVLSAEKSRYLDWDSLNIKEPKEIGIQEFLEWFIEAIQRATYKLSLNKEINGIYLK